MSKLPPATKRERNRVQTTFNNPSKTKQSFKDECDINNVMLRYEKTGVLPPSTNRQPLYGDFTEVPDYQTALGIVYTAEDQFLQLPSQMRKFFNNDPAFMLAYIQDPKNKAMCQKLGLLPQDKPAPEQKKQDPATGKSEAPAREAAPATPTSSTK